MQLHPTPSHVPPRRTVNRSGSDAKDEVAIIFATQGPTWPEAPRAALLRST